MKESRFIVGEEQLVPVRVCYRANNVYLAHWNLIDPVKSVALVFCENFNFEEFNRINLDG